MQSGRLWASGRIETAASTFAAPAGGQMEVLASIKQPSPANGWGYWPAFWMLGAGFRASGAGTSGIMACPKWPSVGEIDILEDVNALARHSGTLHCGIGPGGPCRESAGLTSEMQPCPGCQAGCETYSVIVNRQDRMFMQRRIRFDYPLLHVILAARNPDRLHRVGVGIR
jgi:hypothetical protein